MISFNKTIEKFILSLLLMIFSCTSIFAQTTPPIWWFGASGAANFNFYTGTTQRLNNSLIVPTAFHKGNGVRPYGSVLVEYRPSPVFGLMLNVGYDGLGAKYDGVTAPCNCPATLKADLSYVSVEPSLRFGFNNLGLFFFAGPSVAFNVDHSFYYTQLKQVSTDAQLSNVQKTIFSGQIGAGYDILLSAANSVTQFSLSPFVSYHPYFGQDPRSIESLSITTVRAGVALKFGKGHKVAAKPIPAFVPAPINIRFTVTAPSNVPLKREVSETFPLLNAVFFDEGQAEIPARYVLLTKEGAAAFKEDQLQNEQLVNMTGRSAGQLNVYHNVLNIVGNRMLLNPGATIRLDGSSAKGPDDAKQLAGTVKSYLMNSFGIDGSRIAVTGSLKAHPSSEHPGGTKDLELLRAENRRVDIESTSPELLGEVGGGMMKPVLINAIQPNPLDSHVILNVDSARQLLSSWSVDITSEQGALQHYGPFRNDQESIPGATILGDSPGGDYKVVLKGEAKNGTVISKESSVHLIHHDDVIKKGFRYSIIFNFDKAISIAAYDKFLKDIVSPLILDGSTVIIHGHTDIIGTEEYNQKLSENRASETQKLLEHDIENSGRGAVKFETFGFGADANHSQFDNVLPEERFYNRSVIIDIIPAK